MRISSLLAGSMTEPAKADPYKWSAEYGGGNQGCGNSNFDFLKHLP